MLLVSVSASSSGDLASLLLCSSFADASSSCAKAMAGSSKAAAIMLASNACCSGTRAPCPTGQWGENWRAVFLVAFMTHLHRFVSASLVGRIRRSEEHTSELQSL